MESHLLITFEAVARRRSFTRAAEELCLTQPAVTRQIAALENSLKTRVFNRAGRSVELTSSGEALYRYVEQIMSLMQEAEQAVRDIESGDSGRLIVGASHTLAAYLLPGCLSSYRDRFPRVDISIQTGVSAVVLEMVRHNRVDVGLVTSEVDDAALEVWPLGKDETLLAVPVGHPLGTRHSVEARDLAGLPLILMEQGTNLRAYVDRLLSSAGIREQAAIELDNVEAIKRMVEAGLGVSLLPAMAVKDEVTQGRLKAVRILDVLADSRLVNLVYRRGRYQTNAVKAFILQLNAMSLSRGE